MSTRPRLRLGSHLAPGILAIALFVVLTFAVIRADFATAAGLPEGESVVANIGFALLNIEGTIPSEGFVVALVATAILLDAALSGAVMLATREEDG